MFRRIGKGAAVMDDTGYFRMEEGRSQRSGLTDTQWLVAVWGALLVASIGFWAIVIWVLASNF